jgi:4-hydroxyphenylpyruvate dioxygenase-like putative hemolysin
MKIVKIKSQGIGVYPVTIASAIKDATFQDESGNALTQGEINIYLNSSIKSVTDNFSTIKSECETAISNANSAATSANKAATAANSANSSCSATLKDLKSLETSLETAEAARVSAE